MNRIKRVALGLLATVAMVTLPAACGGDDDGLLPGDDAEEIIANLERVEQLATDGECDEAEEAIDDVAAQVQDLPDFVSDRLRSNLMTGIGRLREVVAENCPDHEIDLEEEPEPDPADEEESEPADDDGEADDADERPDRDRGNRDRPDRDPSGGEADRDRPSPGPSRPDSDNGGDQPRPIPVPTPDDTGGIVPGDSGNPSGDAQ